MEREREEALIAAARAVRQNAHAPYSGFRVGAAVVSESGKVYVGCNVESASYGATLCAERSAIAQMVASGETNVVGVAVFVDAEQPAMPCGICRQVIADLGPDADVVSATPKQTKRTTIAALLPDAFVFKREG